MKRFAPLALSISSFVAVQVAHAADPCAAQTGDKLLESADAPWAMQIQFDPKDVPLNAPFDVFVTVCSQSHALPTRITIDATMPAHKHGMNYEPKTEYIENRSFQAKNLLFHMPGIWRLEVTAYKNNKTHRFTHDLDIR